MPEGEEKCATANTRGRRSEEVSFNPFLGVLYGFLVSLSFASFRIDRDFQ